MATLSDTVLYAWFSSLVNLNKSGIYTAGMGNSIQRQDAELGPPPPPRRSKRPREAESTDTDEEKSRIEEENLNTPLR